MTGIAAAIAEIRSRIEALVHSMFELKEMTPEAWSELERLFRLHYELRWAESRSSCDAPDSTSSAAEADPMPAIEEEADGQSEPDGHVLGTFRRSLRGGVVELDGGDRIHLGESLVVMLDFLDGDRIRCRPNGFMPDGRVRYFFEVAEKCGGVNEDRVEELAVLLELPGVGYRVQLRQGEAYVSEHDVQYHAARNGDVLTVAYWKSELRKGSVPRACILRVHADAADEAGGPVQNEPSGKTARKRAGGDEESKGRQSDESGPERFIGAPRILLVGGRNWAAYRDGIEAMGGIPRHIAADRIPRQLEAIVAGQDIVILVPQYSSHKLIDRACAAAKETGRLLWYAQSENWSGLLRQLQEAIVPAWNQLHSGDSADSLVSV